MANDRDGGRQRRSDQRSGVAHSLHIDTNAMISKNRHILLCRCMVFKHLLVYLHIIIGLWYSPLQLITQKQHIWRKQCRWMPISLQFGYVALYAYVLILLKICYGAQSTPCVTKQSTRGYSLLLQLQLWHCNSCVNKKHYVLAYADDIVLLTPSWRAMQNLLSCYRGSVQMLTWLVALKRPCAWFFSLCNDLKLWLHLFDLWNLGMNLQYVSTFKYLGHASVNNIVFKWRLKVLPYFKSVKRNRWNITTNFNIPFTSLNRSESLNSFCYMTA